MTTGTEPNITILFQIQCKLFTFNAVLKTKSISVVGSHSYMKTCKLQKSQNSCMNPDEKLKNNKSYIKFTFFFAQKQKS